jgi:NAD(P)-dependent dehydrogenase (short-subunit alcohol dehydrogenase family)
LCPRANLTVFKQGTGIGASIARSFAIAGSKKIAIIGRRPKPLEDTARQLQADFPELKVVVQSADITNQEQVNQAFDAIAKEFGTIDVLASNAGVVSGAGTINELEVEEAWKTFEGIVKGNLLVARAFSRVASKQGAVVVHTSSVCAALRAFPGAVAYTASKLAATKIWDYFGVENPGIRVVSIQPGQIQTTMADELGIKMPDSGACTWPL